jgi:subtilisin family serine protease
VPAARPVVGPPTRWPGSGVYSTMPTYPWFTLWLLGYPMNYASMDGTSMACPHVAGVGAAYFCHAPNMTNVAVRTHMRANADDLGTPGPDIYYGYGRVDMWPVD